LDDYVKNPIEIGKVVRIDLKFAERIWGKDHIVDISDFDSPEDFAKRGVGIFYESRRENNRRSLLFLGVSKGIEVSLYVDEEYRRCGIATALSSRLLKWCLENETRANWDAANVASCNLAEKSGYKLKGSYKAYYLEPQS